MKKGKIYTCNGCLAFEHSVRTCPIGSPFAHTNTEPYCGLGFDIEKKLNKDYKPTNGECSKPKNISDYVSCMRSRSNGA